MMHSGFLKKKHGGGEEHHNPVIPPPVYFLCMKYDLCYYGYTHLYMLLLVFYLCVLTR